MWIWSLRQSAICSVVVIYLLGCSNAREQVPRAARNPDPRVVHVFASRNLSNETIRVVLTTGFTPDAVSLGGLLTPAAAKNDSYGAYENLPPIRVAQTVGIVWINGAHSWGSQEEKAAERHKQDVSIPDEILANHKDREDILGFTFGPDKQWTVKLIPKAERGW